MDPLPIFENAPDIIEENNSCSICLDNMTENIYNIPECNHKFHTNCIIVWFRSGNNTCPLCRKNQIDLSGYYKKTNLFRIIYNYSRRKNAPKNLVKLVAKYKKAKLQSVKASKELNEFRKKNKEIFKNNDSLRDKRWKLDCACRTIKDEILSIPVTCLTIPRK